MEMKPAKVTRPSTKVDRELLQSCIAEVEDANPELKQLAMLKKVAELYNQRKTAGDQPISYTVARLRIGEWGLDHKTLPQIRAINRGSRK